MPMQMQPQQGQAPVQSQQPNAQPQQDAQSTTAKLITGIDSGMSAIQQLLADKPVPDELKQRLAQVIEGYRSVITDLSKSMGSPAPQQGQEMAPPEAAPQQGPSMVPSNRVPLTGGAGSVPRPL